MINKYIPSEKLVDLLYSSIIAHKKTTINIFSIDNNPTKQELANYLHNNVQGFFATLSQGLAYGDAETFLASKEGQLTEDVILGFMQRMPIVEEYQNDFHKQLYIDIVKAAENECLTNEFGKVMLQDNNIVIQRIKTIDTKNTHQKERGRIVRIG